MKELLLMLFGNSIFPYLLEGKTHIGRCGKSKGKSFIHKLKGKVKTTLFEGRSYFFDNNGNVVSPPLPKDFLEEFGPNRKGLLTVYLTEDGRWMIKKNEGAFYRVYVNGREITSEPVQIKKQTTLTLGGYSYWRKYEGEIVLRLISPDYFQLSEVRLNKKIRAYLKKDLKQIDKKIEKEEKDSWKIVDGRWLDPLLSSSLYEKWMKPLDYYLTLKWAVENALELGYIKGNARLVFYYAKCPYI